MSFAASSGNDDQMRGEDSDQVLQSDAFELIRAMVGDLIFDPKEAATKLLTI